MTAEDVLPENTGIIGQPDKANAGWDPHFGYGRVNLAGAMERIESGEIPPEAQLDAPDWFAPINVDRVPASGVAVRGRVAAPHSDAGVGDWGSSTPAARTRSTPSSSRSRALSRHRRASTACSARSPSRSLADLAANCDGSVAATPAARAGPPRTPGRPTRTRAPTPSATPSRSGSPSTRTANADNFGRYRKTLFAYENDGNLDGWPRAVGEGSVDEDLITGSGGEAPPRLYDLDGDNALDVLLPTSSGELYALDSAGDAARELQRRRAGRARARSRSPPRGGSRPSSTARASRCARPRSATSTATASRRSWRPPASTSTPGTPTAARSRASRSGSTRRSREPCVAGAPEPCFDTGRAGDQRRATTSSAASPARRRSPTCAGAGRRGAQARDRRRLARPARLRVRRRRRRRSGTR